MKIYFFLETKRYTIVPKYELKYDIFRLKIIIIRWLTILKEKNNFSDTMCVILKSQTADLSSYDVLGGAWDSETDTSREDTNPYFWVENKNVAI